MPSKGSTHILYITEIQAIALHNFGQRDGSTLPAAVRDESTISVTPKTLCVNTLTMFACHLLTAGKQN